MTQDAGPIHNTDIRQTLRQLARMTSGYSLVSVLRPLLTILLTPLYAHVMEPDDYGVVDVTLTLASLLVIVVDMGIGQALNAHFYDGDATHQRSLITTAAGSAGLCGLVLGGGIAMLADPLAHLFFKDPARSTLFYFLAVHVICAPVYGIVSGGLVLQMRVRRATLLGLVFLGIIVTASVVLVLVFNFKATGVVAANVIASMLGCAIAIALAWNVLWGQLSSLLLKSLLRTGLSLLPGALSGVVLLSVDRLLLVQFVSQGEIGLYSIANKLASMIWVLTSALEMAPQPGATQQYARIFEYMMVATMWLSLLIGLFAPEILGLFTRPAYVPAAPYALALLIYYGPFTMAANFFGIGLYVKKHTSIISMFTMAAAGANILLNLALDPLLGVWGAVWATVLAATVSTVAAWFFSQQAMPIPYRMGRLLILLSIYVGLTGFFLMTPAAGLMLKASALMVLSVAVLAAGIITRGQFQLALSYAGCRLRRIVHRNA